MSQPEPSSAREVHPFSLDLAPDDRNFYPAVVASGAEDEDPKASSAQELADFSDTVPQMEPEESDLAGSAATTSAAKGNTPPRVPRPGKPGS